MDKKTVFDKARYLVRKKGTDLHGHLICGKRSLSPGEDVLCPVGDSDVNGDCMVLCMNYESFDRHRIQPMSAEDLEQLNAQVDVDLAEFRANLEELDRKRIERKSLVDENRSEN
jgi:hypothetical protein